MKSRRSNRIIHVRLRSTPVQSSTLSNPTKSRSFRSRVKPHPQTPSQLFSEQSTRLAGSEVRSNRAIDDKSRCSPTQIDTTMKKDNKDQTGPTMDHHRNHKKKAILSKFQKIVVGIVVAVIGMVVIGIVLSLSLTLPRRSVTKRPNQSAVLRWNPEAITVAGYGSGGNFSNSLSGPYGFTMDSLNTLYIVDSAANRITKWIPGATSGTIIAGPNNGLPSNSSQGFSQPIDLHIEPNGDMYITEGRGNRLQLWSFGATSGVTIAGVGSNITATTLSRPSGIVRNEDTDEFYIACTNGHAVISYPSGTVLAGGNGAGNQNHQLYSPIGLVYDSFSNSLVIPNYSGHSMVRWTLGSSQWTLLAGTPGTAGNASNLLNGTVGITMDPMGNIYCADSNNHRIQLFQNGQSDGITIAGISGIRNRTPSTLDRPYWVELDNQLNLYVADTFNGRIQKFLRY